MANISEDGSIRRIGVNELDTPTITLSDTANFTVLSGSFVINNTETGELVETFPINISIIHPVMESGFIKSTVSTNYRILQVGSYIGSFQLQIAESSQTYTSRAIAITVIESVTRTVEELSTIDTILLDALKQVAEQTGVPIDFNNGDFTQSSSYRNLLDSLNRQKRDFLLKNGYIFNELTIELIPNAETGEIDIPLSYLTVEIIEDDENRYAIIQNKIRDTRENTFVISNNINVKYQQNLGFHLIPALGRNVIIWETIVNKAPTEANMTGFAIRQAREERDKAIKSFQNRKAEGVFRGKYDNIVNQNVVSSSSLGYGYYGSKFSRYHDY